MHKVRGHKTEEEITDYEWANTLQNKIIIGFGAVIIGMITIVGINIEIISGGIGHEQKPQFLTKVVKELGDTVILAPQTFVSNPEEIEADNITVTSEILKSPDYKSYDNGMVETAGKQYLGVGNYDVQLKYKGKNYKAHLIVQDTTPPEFTNMYSQIAMKTGEKLEAKDVFEAKDYSTFDIYYSDISKVDFNKPGIYPAEVTAKDEYGNKTTEQFKIKVKKATQTRTDDNSYSMSGQIKTFTNVEDAMKYGYECIDDGKARGFDYYTNSNGQVVVRLK